MEHYFVDFKIHNAENGGWAFKTTKHSEDYDAMLKEFHAQCQTYIGGTTFDHVVVTLTDAYGNILKIETWDMKAVIEEPIVEPSEVEE